MLIFSFLNTALALLLTFVDGITTAQESFDEYDLDITSCNDKLLGRFYVDVSSGCRTFHACVTDGQGFTLLIPFSCGNETLFDESLQQCVEMPQVSCLRDTKIDIFDKQRLNQIEHRKKRQTEFDTEDEGREFVPPNENNTLLKNPFMLTSETNFSCLNREMGQYYADVQADCKIFHVCAMGVDQEVLDFRFMCLDGKLFDQDTGTCQLEHKVSCMDPTAYKLLTTPDVFIQEEKEGEDETEEVTEEPPKSKKDKTKPKSRGKTPKPKVDPDYEDEEQDASFLKPVMVEVSPGFEVIRSKRQLGQQVGVPCYSYEDMPRTGFTCQGMIPGGYYADPATNCQMYHVCAPGVSPGIMIDFKFLCTNNTVFDQRTRTCMDFDAVDCASSVSYYGINTDLIPPPPLPEVTELPSLPIVTARPIVTVRPVFVSTNSATNPPATARRTVQSTQQGRKFQTSQLPKTTKKVVEASVPPRTTFRVTRPISASTPRSFEPLPSIPPVLPPVNVINGGFQPNGVDNGGFQPNGVDNGFNGIILPDPTELPQFPDLPPGNGNGPIDVNGEFFQPGPLGQPDFISPEVPVPVPVATTVPPVTKSQVKNMNTKNNGKKPAQQQRRPVGVPPGFGPPEFFLPDFMPHPDEQFPFVEPFQPDFFPPPLPQQHQPRPFNNKPKPNQKPKQSGTKEIPPPDNNLGFPDQPLPIEPTFNGIPLLPPILPESLDYPGDFFPMDFGLPEPQKLIPKPIFKPGKGKSPTLSNLPVVPVKDVTFRQGFNPVPAGSEFVEMWIQPAPIYVQSIRVTRQAELNPDFTQTHILPVTSFTCRDKVSGGYYADIETDCQMFHVCARGSDHEFFDFKFLCTNETVFNQKSQTCEPRNHVACHSSSSLFPLVFDNINRNQQPERVDNRNAQPEVLSGRNLDIEDDYVDESESPVDLVKRKRSHEIEDTLPTTSFTCRGKPTGGYYGDVETSCRTFHVCSRSQTGEVLDFHFRCAENTAFDQRSRICDDIDQVECEIFHFETQFADDFIEVPKTSKQ